MSGFDYQSAYNETSFTGQYVDVENITLSGGLKMGLTTINDLETTIERTLNIPNSGTDGEFVISNGDVDQIIGGDNTFTGMNTFEQMTTFETIVRVNAIDEYTTDHGVLIDGLTIMDGQLSDTSYSTGLLHSDSVGSITSSQLVNSDVSNTAAIAYGKLNLSNSILGSDVYPGTNLAINELHAGGDILCDETITATELVASTITSNGVVISPSVIADTIRVTTNSTGVGHFDSLGHLTSSLIVGSDITSNVINNGHIASSAGIVYSKLNLTNSIIGSDVYPGSILSIYQLNTGSDIVCDETITCTELDTGTLIVTGSMITPSVSTNSLRVTTLGSGIAHVDSLGYFTSSLITNSDIISGAGISYSKLNLVGSVTNTDLAGSIAYSKLILTNSVTNTDLAGSIAYGKLILTGSITNSDLAGSIAYSKLILTNSVTNTDLAGSIAYSKLILTNSVTNTDLAGSIAYGKLILTNSVTNSDLAGSIAYSKLILTNSVTNTDLAGSIAYSKLVLANSVTNSDLAGSIADTKLLTISTAGKVSNSATTATSTNTNSAIVARDSSGNFSAGSITATGLTTSGILTVQEGSTNGLQWANTGLGSLSSIYSVNRNTFVYQMNGSTTYTFLNTGISTSPYTSNGVLHSNVTTGQITSSFIVDSDVSNSAAILDTKLNTISTAGKVSNSATTATSANTNSAIVARDGSGNFLASRVSGTSFSLDAGTNSISGIMTQNSWSPTVTDAAGNQCTYLSRSGTYSRLGNRVWVNAYIQINAKTGLTGTDTLRIANLPYAVVSFGNIGNWYYGSTSYTPPANTIGLYCEAIQGQSYCAVGFQITTGGRGALVSEINASGFFSLSCCYSV